MKTGSLSHPKISIIVPIYNIEKYLPKCLDSLIGQTYDNIEIICVNDGSPDNCQSILDEYSEKYPQIKVIQQKNAGVSASRNTGMSVASGDYIMFVDGDDWVDETICAELLGMSLAHSADCTMCSYCKEYPGHSIANHIFAGNIVWNEQEVAKNFHRRLFGLIGEETAHPEHIDLIVSPWMQLFKRELCSNITFIDLQEIGSAEDCLFQMEVYAKCKKFAYIDKPLYHYRKDNVTSLTTKHNPYLSKCWRNLYNRMEKLISDNHYPEIYRDALNNRILFGLIGLGLNEVAAKTSMFKKAERLKCIIQQEHYQKAFAKLNTAYMPLHWKIFFFCAKYKMVLFLVSMLEFLNFARKRI